MTAPRVAARRAREWDALICKFGMRAARHTKKNRTCAYQTDEHEFIRVREILPRPVPRRKKRSNKKGIK